MSEPSKIIVFELTDYVCRFDTVVFHVRSLRWKSPAKESPSNWRKSRCKGSFLIAHAVDPREHPLAGYNLGHGAPRGTIDIGRRIHTICVYSKTTVGRRNVLNFPRDKYVPTPIGRRDVQL